MLIEGVELEAPAAPLHELLAAGLATHPDEPALVSAQRRMTWRELEDASLALAGAYLRMPEARRPDRLADAQPDRADRPLPRLLQGGPGRHAAQLPLHPP